LHSRCSAAGDPLCYGDVTPVIIRSGTQPQSCKRRHLLYLGLFGIGLETVVPVVKRHAHREQTQVDNRRSCALQSKSSAVRTTAFGSRVSSPSRLAKLHQIGCQSRGQTASRKYRPNIPTPCRRAKRSCVACTLASNNRNLLQGSAGMPREQRRAGKAARASFDFDVHPRSFRFVGENRPLHSKPCQRSMSATGMLRQRTWRRAIRLLTILRFDALIQMQPSILVLLWQRPERCFIRLK